MGEVTSRASILIPPNGVVTLIPSIVSNKPIGTYKQTEYILETLYTEIKKY